jgi:hypothetical protein
MDVKVEDVSAVGGVAVGEGMLSLLESLAVVVVVVAEFMLGPPTATGHSPSPGWQSVAPTHAWPSFTAAAIIM